MSSRVNSFVVTLKQDMTEEDAQQFAKAIRLFWGVESVDLVQTNFFNEQAAVARVRNRVYEALQTAFDPKAR